MNKQARLIFLTRNYYRLQNLRFAAVYVLFIALPWVNRRKISQVSIVLALMSLGACIAWYWLLNTYYRRRYGRIEEKFDTENYRKRWRLSTFPLVAPILLGWYFLFRGQHVPPEVYLLYFPVAMLAEGLIYSEPISRRFCYVAAGAITLSVLVSAFVVRMPAHEFSRIYDFAVIGAAMLILGIVDHLLLAYSFRRSSRAIYV